MRVHSLSGRHLPRRGTSVFGFDVQEGLLGGVVIGDAGGQRQPDALLDGGLCHRSVYGDAFVQRFEVARSCQTHTSGLFCKAIGPIKCLFGLIDGSGSEALTARLPDGGGVGGRGHRAGAFVLLHLVQSVGTTERPLFVLLHVS